MSVKVHIPRALQNLTGGRATVQVEGSTVGGAINTLEGVRHRVLDDQGRVRVHVNLFVNGVHIRALSGIETKVGDGDEIVILPSVSGG